MENKDKNDATKDHQYAYCTNTLLETVPRLLSTLEDVREGNGSMNEVQQAMRAVSLKKREMENEIMSKLNEELKELWRDKGLLLKRAELIIDEISKAKGDYDKLKQKASNGTEKARMERLDNRMGELERDYNEIWERVSEIDDLIARRETVALSFGIREISFIERECEQLVSKFRLEAANKATLR